MKLKIINPEDAPSRGRPTRYRTDFSHMAYKLALLGLTNKDIGESLGVSLTTLKTWFRQFPELLTSIKAGKEIADSNVAMGLYQRATGYDYPNEKLFLTKDGDVLREPIMVHVPADPRAAVNWLKNRQPQLWRDKQDIEHSGTMTVTMDLNGGYVDGENEKADYDS